MKTFTVSALAVVMLGAVSLFSAGCTSVQVSEKTATVGEYKLGELQVVSGRSFEAAYLAAKDALKSDGLFLTGDNKQVVEAELKARDAADTLVTVKIEEKTKDNATIRIRYGVTGDLVKAQQLYQLIEKQW